MTTDQRIQYLEAELLYMAKQVASGKAGKIDAIKAYRSATGAPLKDAKEWVEGIGAKSIPIDDARIQRLEDRVYYLERNVLQNRT